MSNNRRKGKRIERYFVHELEEVFPDIRRNAGTQSQSGGVDLENTGCFNFEVKGGKSNTYKGVQDMLDQVEEEGDPENFDVVLVKPHSTNQYDKKTSYALIPLDDFLELLGMLKGEGII